jgi:phosphoribosylformylglycinamidine synthase subunit PurQ / glutaminase
MAQPRILILRAPGTNCDGETAYAFTLAGGRPDVLHVNRVLEQPELFKQYQILCLPGGFSYGDDIASGRIFANQLRLHLNAALGEFRAAGKLILGICNGFQILIRSGLLLEDEPQGGVPATLAWNVSGKYEDRWVNLRTDGSKCVFLAGIRTMYLPVAHGEGRFVVARQSRQQELAGAGQLALRYARLQNSDQPTPPEATTGATSDDALPYPDNPNGAQANVAGICDSTGRVFGLMPHPERHIDPTQHPRWTRGEARTPGDGLRIFANAVSYFS